MHALQDIHLDVAGGMFGLLGPNGAGKSTLIHCIMGLAKPTSGSISVFGHDAVTDYQQARQSVGLAPQEINLDWFLSVEQVLDYHGGYYGMSKHAMVSDSRKKSVTLPRQVAMYICRTETAHSLPEIGMAFGGRDHSTVVHSVNKIANLLGEKPVVAAAVRAITEDVRALQRQRK